MSTMGSAFDLGRLIEHDLKSGAVSCTTKKPGFAEVAKLLDNKGNFPVVTFFSLSHIHCHSFDSGVQVVTFKGWERIDSEEQKRGKEKGKPREKITDVNEMMQIALS